MTSVGLNFRDVLNVLGMYPGDAGDPGGDCTGIVTAAGAEAIHRCASHWKFLVCHLKYLHCVILCGWRIPGDPDDLGAAVQASLPPLARSNRLVHLISDRSVDSFGKATAYAAREAERPSGDFTAAGP